MKAIKFMTFRWERLLSFLFFTTKSYASNEEGNNLSCSRLPVLETAVRFNIWPSHITWAIWMYNYLGYWKLNVLLNWMYYIIENYSIVQHIRSNVKQTNQQKQRGGSSEPPLCSKYAINETKRQECNMYIM